MSAAARRRGPSGFPRATVRLGRPADLDALVALETLAFALDRASPRAIRHALRSPSMSLLVAVSREGGEDTLVGAATLERRSNSLIARLASIAVARSGLGLGALLLDAAETDSQEHGRTRLRLEVRVDNVAAIRLYERAGYRRYAIRPDYYEDGAKAWCYEKALIPG